jgi:hypothetical protein
MVALSLKVLPETLEKPLMKLPEVSFSLKPRPGHGGAAGFRLKACRNDDKGTLSIREFCKRLE